MPMLPSRHFLSEPDAFLRDYAQAHPEVVEKQKAGMRLWWGQPTPPDTQAWWVSHPKNEKAPNEEASNEETPASPKPPLIS